MTRLGLIFVLAMTSLCAGQSDRRILVELDDELLWVAGQMELDVWAVLRDRGSLEVRVSPAELAELRELGDPVILIEDVYRDLAPPAPGGEPWTSYHDLEGAYALLDELHAAHPNTSELFEIGRSIEGRPIRGIRLGADGGIDDARPAILITGCHHAREWISVEVPLYLASRLLDEYGSSPRVTSLLDRGEIWIVPVTNPDGFKYTEIDRFWRKNRRNNEDGTFGVDLNRNYSFEWGHDNGSSGNTGSPTYRGPAPFSEPETQAIRDLYLQRDFAAGITYHSYSQYVMPPWGFTTDAPPGSEKMEALADGWADVLNDVGATPFGPYFSGRWGVLLYIGSGIFVDWVYGDRGVPSFIVELPPRFGGQGGFVLAPEHIVPTCEENYEGAIFMLEELFFEWCPSDCDRSTGHGALDVLDFVCFQEAFFAGSTLADCNADGELSVLDFVCFQLQFVDGCPWPDE